MTENGPSGIESPATFSEFDAVGPSAAPLIPPKAQEAAPAAAAPAPEGGGEPAKPAETPTPETPAAEPEPAKGPKPDDGEGGDEPPEPETGPFQFAGRGYKDQAAAENHLLSAAGRAKAEARRAAEREAEVKRLREEKEQAIASAHAWKEVAEKPRPTQDAKPAADPKPAEKDPLETLPWNAIKKLAEEEGLDLALFETARQVREQLRAEFDKKLKAANEPLQRRIAAEDGRDYTVKMFGAAADAKFIEGPLAGQPIYPELNEGEATNAVIADIWRDLDPSIMFTPRGVHMAVLEFRNRRDIENRSKPKPKDAPAPSGAQKAVEEADRAARKPPESLNGGGVPRTTDEPPDPRARFKARIEGAGDPVRAPDGTALFLP